MVCSFFLAIMVTACRDLFEKDIHDKQVEVISPRDGVTATEGEVALLWNRVESAQEYHITIVSPDFERASRVVADTIIPDSLARYSLTVELTPGIFQWNIRARNSAYETRHNILDLYIEELPMPEEKDEN